MEATNLALRCFGTENQNQKNLPPGHPLSYRWHMITGYHGSQQNRQAFTAYYENIINKGPVAGIQNGKEVPGGWRDYEQSCQRRWKPLSQETVGSVVRSLKGERLWGNKVKTQIMWAKLGLRGELSTERAHPELISLWGQPPIIIINTKMWHARKQGETLEWKQD